MKPTEVEKIFSNDISTTWLVSKIHKEFTQLNTKKKQTNPSKKGQKT